MKLSEIRKLTQKLQITSDNVRNRAEIWRELGLEPGTIYQELEMESRYVDTHQDTSYSNMSVSLHSHTFFELLYCRNTCGAEYLIGAERYRLQKGDILIVRPGVSHRPLLPEQMTTPYKRDVLWISPEFFAMLHQLFGQDILLETMQTNLLRTAETPWEFLGEKIRQGVKEAQRRESGWEAAVVANTIQLVVQLCRAIQEDAVKPLKAEKPELLDQVLAYVEQNLSRKITLAEVAQHFYVSDSTISQTFRKRLGVSFYRCVTQRRLIAAKTLIEAGVLLEDVGHQVGFLDYSTFFRAFKQEYGISPRQYRKLRETSENAML